VLELLRAHGAGFVDEAAIEVLFADEMEDCCG